MKIKLLNDGGHNSLDGINFPVVVSGFRYGDTDHAVGVTGGELIKAGAKIDDRLSGLDFAFLIGEECEIVDE